MHGIFLVADENWIDDNGHTHTVQNSNQNEWTWIFIFSVNSKFMGMFFVIMPVYNCPTKHGDIRKIWLSSQKPCQCQWKRDRMMESGFSSSCLCTIDGYHLVGLAVERDYGNPPWMICMYMYAEYNIILMMISCVRICVSCSVAAKICADLRICVCSACQSKIIFPLKYAFA